MPLLLSILQFFCGPSCVSLFLGKTKWNQLIQKTYILPSLFLLWYLYKHYIPWSLVSQTGRLNTQTSVISFGRSRLSFKHPKSSVVRNLLLQKNPSLVNNHWEIKYDIPIFPGKVVESLSKTLTLDWRHNYQFSTIPITFMNDTSIVQFIDWFIIDRHDDVVHPARRCNQIDELKALTWMAYWKLSSRSTRFVTIGKPVTSWKCTILTLLSTALCSKYISIQNACQIPEIGCM